jgi:hypothetical protein
MQRNVLLCDAGRRLGLEEFGDMLACDNTLMGEKKKLELQSSEIKLCAPVVSELVSMIRLRSLIEQEQHEDANPFQRILRVGFPKTSSKIQPASACQTGLTSQVRNSRLFCQWKIFSRELLPVLRILSATLYLVFNVLIPLCLLL